MAMVLIVEDEGLIALALEEMIDQEGDLHALAVPSIELAKRALAEPVDFVLLDINVRDGRTFGLARELLSGGVPFAFMSGWNEQDMPEDLQVVPFLSKPCRRHAIIAAIRSGLAPTQRRSVAQG